MIEDRGTDEDWSEETEIEHKFLQSHFCPQRQFHNNSLIKPDWCFLYESLALQSTIMYLVIYKLLVATCSWWWILSSSTGWANESVSLTKKWKMKWLSSCAQSSLLPEQINTQTVHVYAQLHKETLNLGSFCLWYGQGQPTAFYAWDSHLHLPVTPVQLIRPGIGRNKYSTTSDFV